MNIVLGVAIVVISIGLGVYIERMRSEPETTGVLKIDTSDPDGPYIFLELNEEVNTIMQQEYVTFKVDISKYVSQD